MSMSRHVCISHDFVSTLIILLTLRLFAFIWMMEIALSDSVITSWYNNNNILCVILQVGPGSVECITTASQKQRGWFLETLVDMTKSNIKHKQQIMKLATVLLMFIYYFACCEMAWNACGVLCLHFRNVIFVYQLGTPAQYLLSCAINPASTWVSILSIFVI